MPAECERSNQQVAGKTHKSDSSAHRSAVVHQEDDKEE